MKAARKETHKLIMEKIMAHAFFVDHEKKIEITSSILGEFAMHK